METRRLSKWLLVVGCLLTAPLYGNGQTQAADKSLRLKCMWDLSQDLKTGLVQRVSGVQMLLFKPTGSTYGQLEVEGMATLFAASLSDNYLTAETRYKSGATVFTEKVEVNRFTGGIRKWLRSGDRGSLYQGKCTTVTGPLF